MENKIITFRISLKEYESIVCKISDSLFFDNVSDYIRFLIRLDLQNNYTGDVGTR